MTHARAVLPTIATMALAVLVQASTGVAAARADSPSPTAPVTTVSSAPAPASTASSATASPTASPTATSALPDRSPVSLMFDPYLMEFGGKSKTRFATPGQEVELAARVGMRFPAPATDVEFSVVAGEERVPVAKCSKGSVAGPVTNFSFSCETKLKAPAHGQAVNYTARFTARVGDEVLVDTQTITLIGLQLDVSVLVGGKGAHNGEVTVPNTREYPVTVRVRNTYDTDLPSMLTGIGHRQSSQCVIPALKPGEIGECTTNRERDQWEHPALLKISFETSGKRTFYLLDDQAIVHVIDAKQPVSFPRDANADGWPDIAVVSPEGRIHEIRPGSDWRTAPKSSTDVRAFPHLFYAGQWDASGVGEIGAVSSDGTLWAMNDRIKNDNWDGTLRLGCCGWADYASVFSPGDADGDGRSDILAVDKAGALYFYSHKPDNTYGERRYIDWGWNMHAKIFAAGDQNGDSKPDIMAVDQRGTLWMYEGLGDGRFANRRVAGSFGWEIYEDLVGLGDFNGDGRHDLVAKDRDGKVWWYENRGTNDFHDRHLVEEGLHDWRLIH